MPEDKIRVSARIPKELYDTCLQRYDNITNAINMGLELLCNQSEDDCQTPEDKNQQSEDRRQTYEDARQTIEDTNRQAYTQELNARLEEKDKHIETLQKELDKAERDKEDLKSIYNNYFLQVQTLINQKAIEAPGEKKKPFWKFW